MDADDRTKDINFQYGSWLSSPPFGEEIVISGMAGKFPQSRDVQEFCDHLFNKRSMITDDDRRWTLDHPEIPKHSAKIYDIDKLDAGHFGLHYRQTNNMDPLLRMALEAATEAVMDAGINPTELEGTKTAVFYSAIYSDVEFITLKNITEPQAFAITGYLRSLISHRISYFLKLQGPATNVDAACSSSLSGLAQALYYLRTGQCDYAIVGGSALQLHPGLILQFYRLGILSKSGHARVFDQDADGYIKGESVACVFLQRAKTARRIYATVINSKTSCDGFKERGITFPSMQVQAVLMNELWEETGLSPSKLSYLEAHATGTRVGDLEETEAIDVALAKRRAEPLLVGSVKSNVGHTEGASGVVSVVKVLLAFETGLIGPNISLKRIKDGMRGFLEGRMIPVTEVTKLTEDDALVGINNFGFGGANCHVIMQRHNKKKINGGIPEDDLPRLVCVSGRTIEAVERILRDAASTSLDAEFVWLLHHLYKFDIQNHLYRGYSIISKHGIEKTSTRYYARKKLPLCVFFGHFLNNYKVLGSYLLKFSTFEKTMLRISKALRKTENTLEDIFNSRSTHEDILGSVCVQIGFVDILKALELEPEVFGQSYGKFVSAYYYDVMTLEETLSAVSKPRQFESELDFQTQMSNFHRNEKFPTEILSHDPLQKIILNVSDSHLNNNEILLVNGDTVNLLDILGRLYENGYNPRLYKLYPEIRAPVSRTTPIISPSIQWNHSKDWYTFKFTSFNSDKDIKEYHIRTTADEEFKPITGHVIDGRNLLPATEYLRIVWHTLAENHTLQISTLPVVFTNCKFIKAINIPPGGDVNLVVSIQTGTGNFEVLEKDSLIASGIIRVCENVDELQLDVEVEALNYEHPTEVLEKSDIYKELHLRGYNYSGVFKGVEKCNLDASKAWVRWENNWTSFMDKMLQIKIMQADTRLLFVPIGIKKLTINPVKHLEAVEKFGGEEAILPVQIFKEADIIKSAGIEICGLLVRSIARKKLNVEPILETYDFVPNFGSLDLSTAVRVNTQIILENSLESQFRSLEIIDEYTNPNLEPVLLWVSKALDDLPVVTPELTISSSNVLQEIPGIKMEKVALTCDSNYLLIVGSKILERVDVLQAVIGGLSKNGFVMTRESLNFTPPNNSNLVILTEYAASNEKLILFRKSKNPVETKFVEVSNDFGWLRQLQSYAKDNCSVVLHSKIPKEGILGLTNCIRREAHGSKFKCFFALDDAPDFDAQNSFYGEQMKKDLAINVYKNGTWGTYRHLLLELKPEIKCTSSYVNNINKGDISSLRWLEDSLNEQTLLKNTENLVTIYYSALNFKDIMLASGRISAESKRIQQEALLGFEFSGRDRRGRRVAGMSKGKAIASHVVADEALLWEVPDSWSLEDAATVPVVYSTVIYSLFMVTDLKPGSAILIHSATGGVGLAALNICVHYKCDIYVTVGTKEKRDYLMSHYPEIPKDHIGNSRDTSFEEMIKTKTRNRGVDMVLNSLTDDKLQASVRCLTYGGKFLEIGKYDMLNDTSLNLLLMERGASYYGIMVDRIIESPKDHLKTRLIGILKEGIEAGFVKPLPRVVFNKDEIEKPFRYMMTGKHKGKVLVKLSDEEGSNAAVTKNVVFKAMPRFNCFAQSCYIIVGGLGGIGLELADWLVIRGAKKLVLVSRFGLQTGYQNQRMSIWNSYGVDVRVATQNVTTKQGCIDLLKESNELGPVDAIFNVAVILKDALLQDQTEETFLTSLLPKAHCTQHLDEASRELCPKLRHFVVFSSVTSGRGNVGQSNYGMANSIMERICEKRKREGYPALAIQWGAVGDVGLVARMQDENKKLVIAGSLPQSITNCLEVLDKFLKQEHPVVASMIVAEKRKKGSAQNAVEAVAAVLGIKDLKTVSQHSTLAELGMDSMMGTEVAQLLEMSYDLVIPVKEVRSLTLAKLQEIDAGNKTTSQEDSYKMQQGVNMLVQHIPDAETSHLPFLTLASQVQGEEVAPTVFILPSIENALNLVVPLAEKLKAHVIGLQYQSDIIEDTTIQEIANNTIPHIENKLPKDTPYILIGYSYGAVVSLEAAKLLEKKGYTGKVILIDGSPTYIAAGLKAGFPHKSEIELQMSTIFRIFREILPMNVLTQYKDKLLNCKNWDERFDFALSLVSPDFRIEDKLNKRTANTFYKRVQAGLAYKFTEGKVKAEVHLFKAKYSILKEETDYQLSTLCEKPIQVTEVDANHETIISRPELAEHVNKIVITQ